MKYWAVGKVASFAATAVSSSNSLSFTNDSYIVDVQQRQQGEDPTPNIFLSPSLYLKLTG